MDIITTLIYDQEIEVNFTSPTTTKNRNEKVYAKPITAYRGIDNKIKLLIKNNDHKRVPIGDKSFTFNIIDKANRVSIISSKAIIIDALNGVAEINITEGDMLDLDEQFYHWSIMVTDGEGNTRPGFIDDNYGAEGMMIVRDSVFPEFRASTILTNFVSDITGATDAREDLARNTALHTAQFYFTTYTGDIIVQVTLDPISNLAAANWIDLATLSFEAQVGTTHFSWNGIFTAVRFKRVPTTGTVDKILYRF